ncbi:MAG: VWA domain-containing protein, partial [Limisphaerales bacterium]
AGDDYLRFIPLRQRELLQELKRLQEDRREPPPKLASKNKSTGAPRATPEWLSADVLQKLSSEAAQRAEHEGVTNGVAALRGRWAERARLWSEISNVFGELGELLGRGRDLARSILRHHGWQEIVRLRKLMESCPELTKLVRTLGQLQQRVAEDLPTVMERIFVPIRRADDQWCEVQTEFAPHEVHGLTLSDDISRMIPAEAATLGHPVLKYLWHARRIEHALLTYRVQGVMAERVSNESDLLQELEQPKRLARFERGPIIVCLDTSGSMHGEPEIVAKAIVLEALRVAHAEKRACYLYSFSGPGDVVEHELKLTEQGLAEFLNFLACSFHGGTDIAEPLRRAVDRMQKTEWQRADILIVTDGEFSVTGETKSLMDRCRKEVNLRVHGLLIGNHSSLGLEALGGRIHRFSDWKLATTQI